MTTPHSLDRAETPDESVPVSVRRPSHQVAPIVLASPHSGRAYSPGFLADSKLDAITLRRSEDSFVDEIFGAGPSLGLPLVAALFPRAFCDVNREPYELDQQMFEDRLPAFVNTRSVRVACGLGTIARVVTDGAEIYRRRLSFAEAEQRLRQCYRPYHRALKKLIDDAIHTFGTAILIDCHSMPSVGGPMDQDAGVGRKDIVLGDRYGTSCDGRIVAMIEDALKGLGFDVVRNNPYAGGHTTQLYGMPARGIHAVQIEINRALYMDERKVEKRPGFDDIARKMTKMLEMLAHGVNSTLYGVAAD
ncbi:MAG: N-formylglutamate amidohydrolase [Alphaproteobacteria bacterium]